MKTIGRLLLTYYAATPLLRGLLSLGLLGIITSLVIGLNYPGWFLGGDKPPGPVWLITLILNTPFFGLAAILFASASIPGIAEKLVKGHHLNILPNGRLKLLLSIIFAGLVFALIPALLFYMVFVSVPAEFQPPNIVFKAFALALVDFSLILIAFWVVGKAQGIWRVMSMVLVLMSIALPFSATNSASLFWVIFWGGSAWLVISAFILYDRKITPLFIQARKKLFTIRQQEGHLNLSNDRRIENMLGIIQPWGLALGQLIPAAIASIVLSQDRVGERVWLFFLVSLSTISGAITSQAASKSRTLWLKLDITRKQLFPLVESSYWQYSAWSLGVLCMAFVVLGTLLELSTQVLTLGLPLLILSTIVSAYLGLILTRGLGWIDIILASGTMLLLLKTANTITDPEASVSEAIILEAAIAVLILAFRIFASVRWRKLDWALCRPDPSLRTKV